MSDKIIPQFILAAQPEEQIDIPDFFIESPDNIFFEKLRHPEYLRYTGWNMLTLDYPKIKNGTFWEVKNGDVKTIRLYRDGSLVAIADASEEFLGWGAKNHEDYIKNPSLLALALIEYIYEFINLYKTFIKESPNINSILFKFGFKNVDKWEGKKLVLKPREINISDARYWVSSESPQITKDFMSEIVVKLEEDQYKPEIIAYKIVSEIFTYFNISSDKIPYIKLNELGKKVIDIDKIKKIQ